MRPEIIKYFIKLAIALALGALFGRWLADAAPPTYHPEVQQYDQ